MFFNDDEKLKNNIKELIKINLLTLFLDLGKQLKETKESVKKWSQSTN